tara:strand:- start:1733 stop:1987 length:255 start_codon:yes stop_codon:yes gene_type:complete
MSAMKETNDGFKISEMDLEIRGSGEILGTRQSGGMELKIADLMRDSVYLEKSEKLAEKFENDSELVAVLMKRWIGKKENLIAAQ